MTRTEFLDNTNTLKETLLPQYDYRKLGAAESNRIFRGIFGDTDTKLKKLADPTTDWDMEYENMLTRCAIYTGIPKEFTQEFILN